MKEVTNLMGVDWGQYMENNFQNMRPMEAMDQFYALASQGGENAVNKSPQRLRLIMAMAHLEDRDITDWVNKMVPDHSAVNFNFFLNKMNYYRDVCRKSMDLPSTETFIN